MANLICPFCEPVSDRVFYESEYTYGLWDKFPVNPGHALLIPKRHVVTWFEASREEQEDLMAGVERAKRLIEEKEQCVPDGFNVGMNLGEAAGQTVPHLHVHVIPRFTGDVDNPVGGVRNVVPERADYTLGNVPHGRVLITGGADDPLLPHVAEHLGKAARVDLAVAFLMASGLRLIEPMLQNFLTRGGLLRVVTGTYLHVTEPYVLRVFLDLYECYPDQMVFRVFDTSVQSFHPKAYLFYPSIGESGPYVALVGSSNLSKSALTSGNEWNYRAVSSADGGAHFSTVRQAFEKLLSHSKVRSIDAAWIENYEQQRESVRSRDVEEPAAPPPEDAVEIPEPHPVQHEALKKLEETRRRGNNAGLVVLATGLGKTWLSAFDVQQCNAARVLFVAHREEILRQAMDTYRRIRPKARLGLYAGEIREIESDVMFASIQTLGRQAHLNRFGRTDFDYIVVDEFHHAAAPTYRRLIDHFEPKFLLGLTATPNRTDGADLLALCQYNMVYRCDVPEGVDRKLLSPYHYFGVPDDVEYSQIPWRSGRFNDEELTQALATQSRALNALEQYQKRSGKQSLGFCCSTRHANFMRDFFRDRGIRAAAVHSDHQTSDDRLKSLEKLRDGDLEIVFAVDIFNEGVDLPDIDTVLMLRPTESQVLWLQQFGRGLRRGDKKQLTVIDYIGNHRSFFVKVQTLFSLSDTTDGTIGHALDRYEDREHKLPDGCEVTYDLETIKILRSLLQFRAGPEGIKRQYERFKEQYGHRPTASEMFRTGYRLTGLRPTYRSWFDFVYEMGDLPESDQHQYLKSEQTAEFLRQLETTAMTKSWKMLVLLGMIAAGRFPGGIRVDQLTESVRDQASRSAVLEKDLGVSLADVKALRRKLLENPIVAWIGGKGTGGHAYFAYQNNQFQTTLPEFAGSPDGFAAMVKELADFRLDEYLARKSDEDQSGEEAAGNSDLTIGESYMRASIPPQFGFEFKRSVWEQGFVRPKDGRIICLLVTLDNRGFQVAHQYKDGFRSAELFQWQSQNRHRRDKPAAQVIQNHVDEDIAVHLFVRTQKLLAGRAAPFIYCGEVEFKKWEGDAPITVQWRLKHSLTENLAKLFGIDDDAPQST